MKRVLTRITLALLTALAIAAYGLLLWKGPWWFDGGHLRHSNLQPADGVVITGFRTMLVALGAGAIAAAGVYYTHRKHKLEQEQFRHAQEQFDLTQRQFALAQEQFDLAQQQFQHTQEQAAHDRDKDRRAEELAREAQVTERYVEAIKLLASSTITERLGAIYSLERILLDSPKDRDTVLKVLAAFAREQDWEKHKQGQAGQTITTGYTFKRKVDPPPPDGSPSAPNDDVAAAAWVLSVHRDGAPRSD
ncbi:hypothetical protein [Streptomyces flavidovirens]|uniref:Secreted protein n=1 Tax=Streptomyces flavidovirens TaxID=67298 RepID=A0ABW6R9G6_9ACTN